VARWAAFVNRHGIPDAAWLTVDAGNYVDRAGTGGCSNKCQFMVTSYKDLHYDVLNLGRQEVWMGYETLRAMMDTVKNTEFVSANLIEVKSKRPVVKPFVIKDYGKFRVGVIGLLNEGDFPKGSTLLDTANMVILPHKEAAKKYIPSLARKVDALVLLTELPSVLLDTLVKTYPEIDLVISTGGLRSGETPTTIGKTRIVGSGSSGYNGHYAELEFNPAWKDSLGFRNFQEPLSDTYDEKGVWADRLAAFNSMPLSVPKPNPVPPATQKKLGTNPAPQTTAPAQKKS